MAIDVYWDDAEETIIRYEVVGNWTWDEVYEAVAKATAMDNASDHRVDVIINLTHSGGIPKGTSITHLRNNLNTSGRNWVLCVLVGSDFFLNALLSIFTKIYPALGSRVKLTSSMESAYKLVAESRYVMQQS